MVASCYLRVSAMFTLLSFLALCWWMSRLLDKFKLDDLIDKNTHFLNILWDSHVTIALCVNYLVNVFVLVLIFLKTIFFIQLYPAEIRRTMERLFNYVIYKGAFLPLVVPNNVLHIGMWSAWLITLSSLKMIQTLAKDRLERLNASPSANQWIYLRVFSALLFVLISDICWICLCLVIIGNAPIGIFMLLFFEPLSIAFETLQAIIVHGFQLFEIWHHFSLDYDSHCGDAQLSYKSIGASLYEWKTVVIRNFGFFLDTMTLLMALCHYLIIWWLHGMSFHIVDAVLFLNLRALVSAIIKRIRGFVKLSRALSSLNVALLDATSEELHAFNDDCAICREPMSKAKRLSCNHLFHLPCLRSWLDQGISDVYSCPTCRSPLFPSTSGNDGNDGGEIEHTLHENLGLNLLRPTGQAVPIDPSFDHQQNSTENIWRTTLNATWMPGWLPGSEGIDVVGTSSAVSSGSLSRVQVMLRHLASVGETYVHGVFEDSLPWNFWPPRQRPGPSSVSPAAQEIENNNNTSDLRFRNNSPVTSRTDILVMAERVGEIFPHIPNELIIQAPN
ncbi:E3 ubiquitin protein ligase RIN2 [Zostera marina]|uniref:E3 ubiquitin protein ligase RIN2 n=1 Tax=Zostera marina TaxID=29655 RepID=A0A0K9PSS6_ZOSMR|nr:E3 ubiquitin protein ligase RIN2 [Zostera marina]